MGGVVRAHLLKCLAVTLLTLSVAALSARPVHAQQVEAGDGDRIAGDVAGTVGLGLLGAEVGLFLPPAFNLQDHWWAWVLFPVIGAAGGTVVGVFAFEPRSPEPAVTLSILGASMLLAVPAVVGASALSSARQGRNIDRAQNEGLLRVGARGTSVGVPSISTASVYSASEQARFGLPQRSSTRVSLVSGRF
jgi:hypothetical protein